VLRWLVQSVGNHFRGDKDNTGGGWSVARFRYILIIILDLILSVNAILLSQD
jgi:hypothetical protein